MTRKATILIFLATFLFTALNVYADDGRTEMLRVKKDSQYIYGEGTGETEEQCYEIAWDKLLTKIKDYIASQLELGDADGFLLNNVKQKTKTVSYNRTINIKVMCIYVKKSDITPLYQTGSLNRPVVVADTSSTHITIEIREQEQAQDTVQVSTQIQERQAHEIPTVEQTQPVQIEASPNASADLTKYCTAKEISLIQALLQIKTYDQVKLVLQNRKSESSDVVYRLVKNIPNVSDCYWIVFDNARMVVAVLDKSGSINLLNGSADSIDNYSSSPKLWLQVIE